MQTTLSSGPAIARENSLPRAGAGTPLTGRRVPSTISATSRAQVAACARASRAGGGRRCRASIRSSTPSSSAAQPSSSACSRELVEQAAGHLRRRRPARRARKSTSSPSMPRSAARTLLSSTSSVGYSTSGSLVVEERAQPVGERRRSAPRARPCARAGSAGRRPASRPCRGSGAGARPTRGRCSPRSRPARIISSTRCE